jgi:hypothetical protein
MIFFVVGKKDQGSAILRGIQISEELNKLNVESKVVVESEIPKHEVNSIFVWVKNINPNKIKQLSNNKHIYDVVDNYIYQKDSVNHIINSKLIDHLIVNNEYMKSEICIQNKLETNFVSVIHHHWDPRISNAKKINQDELRFGFLGSVASLEHTDNFLYHKKLVNEFPIEFYDSELGKSVTDLVKQRKKVKIIHNPSAMDDLQINFNCHLSIRENDTVVSKYKTTAKLATASALGHNIITTYERAVEDVLPSDYPFILKDTNLVTIKHMFSLVKKDFCGDKTLWNVGLKMVKTIKNKLSIEQLISEYIKLINDINLSDKK